MTLVANAWSSGSSDGDEFRFDYSTDSGTTWSTGFTVSSTDSNNVQSALLNSASTSIWIRVIDTDRTQGNNQIDTIFVDELYIRTETTTGSPPADPSGLSATTPPSSNQVVLSWVDNASNEVGHEVERSLSGSSSWQTLVTSGPDITSYEDNEVIPNTTYDYRVRAYNGSGFSNYTNVVTLTTPIGISLSTNGYKSKGKANVDLTWLDASSNNVDIYRNNALITTIVNNGSYTDATGQKRGSFSYQVCESGATIVCSNTSVVSF